VNEFNLHFVFEGRGALLCPGKAAEKLAEIMAIIGPLAARTNCTKRSRDSADIGRLQGVSYLR
jgi:hypothetical protein